MLSLGIRKVEKFVREQKELGNTVFWDGWDMVFFRPSEKAVFSTDGAFRNGVWGFDNRVCVNEQGIWEIDFRNVKKGKKRNRR